VTDPEHDRSAMHVVCALDDGYAQHCGVMLCSLFANNADERMRVFVIADRLSDETRRRLDSLAWRPNHAVEHVTIDPARLTNAWVSNHLTLATYFRILIPQYLPLHLRRVLFLDCDLVVRGPLAELYSMPLDGYSHAAVANPFMERDLSRIDLPAGTPYFNAGVLLLNLRKWRQDWISERLVAYVAEKGPALEHHDQDALNAMLHGQWRPCHARWNAQVQFFKNYTAEALGVSRRELREVRTNPSIVHFTGTGKPWTYYDANPFEGDYFRYLALTPWHAYRRQGQPSMKARLRVRMKSLAWRWQ
jgi:lipopolysaccharide biosynthesis glycosyltransferase